MKVYIMTLEEVVQIIVAGCAVVCAIFCVAMYVGMVTTKNEMIDNISTQDVIYCEDIFTK
jgi:hypothetical protein